MRRSLPVAALFASALAVVPALAQELPPGHPPVDGPGALPPAGVAQPAADPLADRIEEAELPPGTVLVELRDGDDRPLPARLVTLGVLVQSVAKGDSRRRVDGTSDPEGVVVFPGLELGSGAAYRISHTADGATFETTPFQLRRDRGVRAVLHAFPVKRRIDETRVTMRTALFVELKDDRVQIQQGLLIENHGREAWVPKDLVVPLPPAFTALRSGETMGDQRVVPLEKQGARLEGTYRPGRHTVEFSWQLPYDGDATMVIDAGLPPRVELARVTSVASPGMHLVVEGFPNAELVDDQGTKVLVTEREAPNLGSVHIELRDLPTQGPARMIATSLSACLLLGGLAYAGLVTRRKPDAAARKKAREQLLAELAELEEAHRAGDVGPKTYERERRQLVDELALLLLGEQREKSAR